MTKTALAVLLALLATAGASRIASDDGEASGDAPGTTRSPTQRGTRARRPVAKARARSVAPPAVADADEVATGGSDPYDFELLSGYVRTPEGAPVAGAFVALGDLDASDTTAITRADGRFALDDLAYYTTVTAAAIRDGQVWTGTAKADGLELNLLIELRPATGRDRTTLVRVLGPDGAPVPEARAVPVDGTPRRPWYGRECVTVRDGWFAVAASRWRRGEHPVYLVEGARGCGPALVRVDPRGPPCVEVRLPSGVALSGRVVTPDGRSVPHVPVLLLFAPMPNWFSDDTDELPFGRPSDLRSQTDAEGRFEFVGLERVTGVVYVVPGGARLGGGLALVEDAHDREVVVRLRPTTEATVVVTDESGAPVAGAGVRSCWADDVFSRADTSESGTCRLTGVPVDRAVSLKVDAVDFVPLHIRDWCAAPTSVVLRREGLVAGRVLGPDGAPLFDVPLTIRAYGEQQVLWSNGRFVVHGVPAGAPFRVELRDDDRVLAALDGVAPASDIVLSRPAEDDRLTLALSDSSEGEWLRGVVVREGDRVLVEHVPGQRVIALDSRAWPESVEIQVGPDPHGRFALLHAVPSRGFRRVEMRDGRRLCGAFVAPEGSEPGVVRCTVTNAEGFVLEFVTESDGTFDDLGVPPGPVTLHATAGEGLEARVEVGPKPGPLEIPLSR